MFLNLYKIKTSEKYFNRIFHPFHQLCVSSQSGEYMAGRQWERERKKGIIAITYFIRVAQSSAYGWELTMGMFCKNVFMMKSNCGSNWTCLPANIITAGLFQRIYAKTPSHIFLPVFLILRFIQRRSLI